MKADFKQSEIAWSHMVHGGLTWCMMVSLGACMSLLLYYSGTDDHLLQIKCIFT